MEVADTAVRTPANFKVMSGRVGQASVLQNFVVWSTAFISLLVALVISDIEISESFRILCVISLQTFGGMLIYRWFTQAEFAPTPEMIGMGFAVGSFTAMIGDQIALETMFKNIGWLLPLIVGILVHFLTPSPQTAPKIQLRSTLTMPWAIAGAFLALGLEWYWTLPIGLTLVLLLTYVEYFVASTRLNNRIILVSLSILVICSTILMLSLRPEIWWIEHTYDFLLYENWSNALSTFGRIGIGGVGYEFNYHWFSYAWNGLVSRVSNASPWIATTRSSILVSVVVIQLLISAVIKQYRGNEKFANLTASIVAMFSTVALWRGDSMHLLHLESFSGVFALVWLLAVFLMVLKSRSSISVRNCGLIVILCVATFGAKTAFGGVALVLVFALLAEATINRRKNLRHYFSLAFVSFGVVILLAKLLFLDSYLPKVWRPSLGFIEFLGAMESENLIFRKHETLLLAFWWIAAALLVQILASVVYALNSFRGDRSIRVIELFVSISCVGLLCLVTFWDGNQNYFAYSGFVLLLPLVGNYLMNDSIRNSFFSKDNQRARLNLSLILFIIVVLSIATRHMPEIGVATRGEVFLRHAPYLASTVVMIAVVALFAKEIKSSAKFAFRVFPPFLIVVLSASSVIFYASEWSHEVNRVFQRWEREGPGKVEMIYGSPDIQEVIEWINTNTPTDSIVAIDYDTSNCPIDPWGFQVSQCTPVAAPRSSQPHMGREVFEGAIRRKMLIRNLHPLTFGYDSPLQERFNDIETKRSALREFSQTGTIESLQTLQKFGVNWFVVNLEQTSNTNSWGSAKIKFRNNSFIVLELPESS